MPLHTLAKWKFSTHENDDDYHQQSGAEGKGKKKEDRMFAFVMFIVQFTVIFSR